MRNKLKLSIYLFFLLSTWTMMAQGANSNSSSLNGGSIKNQYDFLLSKSSNYLDNKVVKKDYLDKFFSNITDSIQISIKEIEDLNFAIRTHEINIDSLNSQLSQLKIELTNLKAKNNGMSLFGLLISKAVYNTLVLLTIIGLGIALIIFASRHRASFAITSKAKKSLEDTRAEFDAFKQKTLEKEQVLMRKLQDELNKNLP